MPVCHAEQGENILRAKCSRCC